MSSMSRGIALLLAVVMLLGMFPATVPTAQGAETDGIVIHSQPEFQHGAVGETVQFTVEASGVASYEWWYRRTENGTWYSTSLTGFNTKTLSVGVTTGRNGYQYRCKLTGNDGSEVYTESAALLVEIDLVAHPQDQVGVITDNVQFSVQASGVSSYQWQYRRTAEDNWTNTSMTGNKTDTITVEVLPSREGYQYRCVLTDSTGTAAYTRAATLYLHDVIREGTCGDGVNWVLDRYGLLRVSGNGKMRNYTPDTPAPWAALSEYITKVEIESTVTQIGAYSFYNCKKLTQISVSDGVIVVGEHAFSGCVLLDKVSLPDSVKQIDGAAFSNCTALSEVNLGNGLELLCYHAFAGCTSLKSVSLPEGLTDIGNDVFNGCTALSSVTFPSTLNFIGVNCFYGCTSLSSIAVGGTLTNVTDSSFAMCTSLTSVTLSGPVARIHKGAFTGCSALTSLTIPATVETIESDAFNGCDALTDVYYGGSDEQRGEISIETGNDPLGLAQWHCMEKILTGVQMNTLPDKTVYEPEDLLDTTGLSLILTYSDGSTSVVTEGFTVNGYNPAVSGECVISVTYEGITVTYPVTVKDSPVIILSQPKSVKAANGDKASFAVRATGVVSYQWEYRKSDDATWYPTSMTGAKTATMYVDVLASRNCYQYRCKLSGVNGSVIYTDVVFLTLEMELLTQPGDQTAMVGQTAIFTFEATGVTTYQWQYRSGPEDSWHISGLAGYNTNTLSVPVTALRDGYQYRCKLTDSTEMSIYTWVATLSLASYVAEGTCGDNVSWTLDAAGVLDISGNGAMDDYLENTQPWYDHKDSIVSVVIHEGVTTIGSCAFAMCESIKDVSIANSVATIGSWAFQGCTFTEIVIPHGVVTIENHAFYQCYQLLTVSVPDSVITVEDGAFNWCSNLETITIGSGLKTIGEGAFGFCDNLTTISVSAENAYFCTDEYGVLYTKDMLYLIRCPGAFAGTYTISDTIQGIAIGAFSECTKLENVVIPEMVFCVEADTFRNNYVLNNITIPVTIQYIDEGAFAGCVGLTDVYYSGSASQWNEISIREDNDPLTNANIHFAERNIVYVDVVTTPRVDYFLYEEFDSFGMELCVSYDDGSVEIVSEGFTLGTLDNTVPGTQMLEIYYAGFTASIEVSFRAPAIIGVDIWSEPYRNEYFMGDPLDITGLELLVYYEDDSSLIVGEDAGFEVSGFDSGVPGTQTLTVSYEGFTANFTVMVRTVEPESIWVETLPLRTQFFVGEEVDTAGLTLGIRFNNGSTILVYDSFTISGYDPNTTGEQTVTVTYENMTTHYGVTYKEPAVTAISIYRLPDKLRYITGELLDTSGLVLEVFYENGDSVFVEDGFEVAGFDTETVGEQALVVAYDGFEAGFTVSVYPGGSCGDGLTWILEDSVLRIYGSGAMEDYSGETSVPWYSYADAITTVIIENGVSTVGAYAFKGLCNATSITLACTVEDIRYAAFSGCSSLTEIFLPDALKRIDSYAFEKCRMLTEIYIPSGVEDIVHGNAFVYCDSLTGIYVDESNMYYSSDDYGVLYDKDKTVLIKVPASLDDGYRIPATVTTIAQWSFHNTDLYSIEIPEGVTVIDLSAFLSCENLMQVSLPTTVTYIGNWAFNFCDSLMDVYYAGSATQWANILFGGGNECLTEARIHFAIRELVGIEIRELPKTDYFLGEELDTTGLRLVLHYDDGSYDITENGFTVTGYDPYMEGEQWLTVGYESFTETFMVTVRRPMLTAVEVSGLPDKTEYYQGETLDTTGLELTLTYEDGSTCTVAEGYAIEYDSDALGTVTVTVTYEGFAACFEISVRVPALIGIEITTLPNKLEYVVGDDLDTTGMTLTLVYENGSSVVVSEGFVVDGFDSNVPGVQDLTVSYEGSTASFTVTVCPQEIEDPVIVAQPTDAFVPNGENGVFTVVATGVASYQWQYRSPNSNTWKNTGLDGCYTDALTVPMITSRNNYLYRCKLTGENGTVIYTDEATLVMDAHIRVVSPGDQTALEGSEALFALETEGIISYRWYYRKGEGDSWHATAMTGYVTNTLRVKVTTHREGYEYRCKMRGEDGYYIFSEPATLHVTPCIIEQPVNQTMKIGQTATFTVQAENITAYQWLYRKSDTAKWSPTSSTGNMTDTIIVPALLNRNGYQYMCKLTNLDGYEFYTSVATLSLLPSVTEPPVDQLGPIGGKVVFTITGDCIFGYQWQYSRDGGTTWSGTNADGNKTDTLSVDVSAGRNGYKYRCKLIGRDGSHVFSDSATLYVSTSIILQPSDQIAQSGDYVRFSVGAKGVGLTYQWQYSSNGGEIWNNTNMTGANTAALSVEATAARNGYRYRCKITDKNGNVTFSDEAILTVE